jgi:S-formylglutathione hydrolase FrmB
MGGYGAFKWAMACPERFAAAASLSGVLDLAHEPPGEDPEREAGLRLVFGDLDRLAGSPNDLFYLARKLAQRSGPKPKLYQCCGVDDFLYSQNVRFRKQAQSLALDLTYEEGPGDHDWAYWDQQIQRVLDWLPLRPLPAAPATSPPGAAVPGQTGGSRGPGGP